MNKNISHFLKFDSNYKNAKAVLFGMGYDGTTSFKPGARFAPNAMREDSYALESYSPYLDKDLKNLKLFDGGDLSLPFGDKHKSLKNIYNYCNKLINDNKQIIGIGGEHLMSLGIFRALNKKYKKELNIMHFDAHTDLRDTMYGEKYSHATVFRRIHEELKTSNIFQFCIRSGLKKEFEYAKKNFFIQKFKYTKLKQIVKNLKDKPVYISFDLDVFDPSLFSGTGTPEPGGIFFDDFVKIIKQLKKLNNIVAFDLMELSPQYDSSGVSTTLACKTLRELTLVSIKK